MIPARFVVEYPKRCLDLLEALEPFARRRELCGVILALGCGSGIRYPL
jgi:hypothetical protein